MLIVVDIVMPCGVCTTGLAAEPPCAFVSCLADAHGSFESILLLLFLGQTVRFANLNLAHCWTLMDFMMTLGIMDGDGPID